MQNSENRILRTGEIYMMKFEGSGSVQRGWRPGLVFQNDAASKFSPNIVALPLTSRLKKTGQPTHVVIGKDSGLPMESMVLCENPVSLSKDCVGEFMTKLSDEDMARVAEAYLLASGALILIKPTNLFGVFAASARLKARTI